MQKIKLLLVAPFAAAAVIAACGGDKPTPPASPTDMVAEAGADMPSTPDMDAGMAAAAPTDTAMAAPSASAAPMDTSMAAAGDSMDAGAADAGKGKKGGKGDKKGDKKAH